MPALSCPRVSSCSESGFSLLTVSIVLAVSALIFVSLMPGRDPNRETLENIYKMQKITNALMGYMAEYDSLPCPSLPVPVNSPYFGVAAANSSCVGGMPYASEVSGNLAGGVSPVTTLSQRRYGF